MDSKITAKIAGADRVLNYSIEVMFNMRDKFGTIQKALDIIAEDSRAAFDAVQWFAVQMANDGELCRREEGYDRLPMLTEKDISPRISPLEYEELKNAVVEAIAFGYRREMENKDEETDLGLAEIREKKQETGA